MKRIYFVTSNKGKVGYLTDKLDPTKYEVVQENIELPELQGNTSKEIAEEKAKAAFKIVGKPLIVQDASFHINVLNGFPGAYIKYVSSTIGLEGLLKLMENQGDRSCYFEMALSYIDEDQIKTFVGDRQLGSLASEIDLTNNERAWGEIWKLFIPDGFTQTLSTVNLAELSESKKAAGLKSEMAYFAEWLANQ